MKLAASSYLRRARDCINRARIILGAGLPEDAGRTAYFAAFHAAQALIFEHTGKVAKTHRGVRSQFAKLTRTEAGLDPELRQFLTDGYNLKSIADYGTGPDDVVPPEEAAAAIEIATRFVDRVETILAGSAADE